MVQEGCRGYHPEVQYASPRLPHGCGPPPIREVGVGVNGLTNKNWLENKTLPASNPEAALLQMGVNSHNPYPGAVGAARRGGAAGTKRLRPVPAAPERKSASDTLKECVV